MPSERREPWAEEFYLDGSVDGRSWEDISNLAVTVDGQATVRTDRAGRRIVEAFRPDRVDLWPSGLPPVVQPMVSVPQAWIDLSVDERSLLQPTEGLPIIGPHGTGSLDTDLRWAAGESIASRIILWEMLRVVPVTFVADDDGVIRARAFWTPAGLAGFDLAQPGADATIVQTTWGNRPTAPAQSLTWETLRRAYEGLREEAIEPMHTFPSERFAFVRCGVCQGCLQYAQVEHLTSFVAGDHVEAFLEYARAGDETTFKALAALLGVGMDVPPEERAAHLDGMYQGTVARLGVNRGTPKAGRTDRPELSEPRAFRITAHNAAGEEINLLPGRGRCAGDRHVWTGVLGHGCQCVEAARQPSEP